uniref:RING-type domain-containing protein n=1 Tax=Strongyloides venezuelensis TaxID=75913 RepID=A0A0K0FU63_STRVS
MPFVCVICSEVYTANVGWVLVKSRLGRFECPTCRQLLLDNDYHPIYDVPNETGRHVELSGKIIEFFGVSNGYILITGYDVFDNDNDDFHYSSYEGSYFLKIYEGDHVCHSRNFRAGLITAVAFIRQAPHVSILIKEKKKINSISYLGHKDIVYSVGYCHQFNIHVDRLNFKTNWLGNCDTKLRTITNLNVANDHVLLGIMNRNIYVFEKDKSPYAVYFEKNRNVTIYVYDSVTNTILLIALEPEDEYDVGEYVKLQF